MTDRTMTLNVEIIDDGAMIHQKIDEESLASIHVPADKIVSVIEDLQKAQKA